MAVLYRLLISESNSMFSFFDRWQNIESDSGNIRKTSRAMDFAVLGDVENSRSFVYKLLFLVLELELIHTAPGLGSTSDLHRSLICSAQAITHWCKLHSDLGLAEQEYCAHLEQRGAGGEQIALLEQAEQEVSSLLTRCKPFKHSH